ncbi:MAG TPA: AMP-binding protein [Casimicrobiaceae bacterium]|jgi:long-chain acyl-CoA synthetase|nr:AMP-binding protein [Casimicrobiaceae bacterium]
MTARGEATGQADATLRDVLRDHLAHAPEAPFLIAPETGRTLRYADIAAETAALAAMLDARGLAAGAVVGLFLPNGLRTTALFLATMLAGRVVAPFNLIAQKSQLAHCLDHGDARIVFTTAQERARLDEALAALPDARRHAIEIVAVDPDTPGATAGAASDPGRALAGLPPIDTASPALLMYTSGTTGLPKGALLTHGNLVAGARAVAAWHGLGRDDRCLSSLPLYHINGQCIATLTPFVSGGSVVAPRRFSVSQWWPLVDAHRPTWLNMVPTIIAYLINATDGGDGTRRAFVRFGRSASAPLPPEQHRAFEARFGVGVVEAMGMTECASVVLCNPQDAPRRKIGSPGLPCGVELKVVKVGDPDDAPLPDGVPGELLLRGPNVMAGYYKEPELTAAAITRDGWLRTGDLGYRDADGFYFITGRLKELIIKGGENIAPREIDEALLAHEAVLEAAAVGVPDPHYGQEILACVVLKQGRRATEDDIREHCLRELGRYKTPRTIRIVAELPKGASGKIQRLKLLDLA